MDLIEKYYNPKIQTSLNIIKEIINETRSKTNAKMLVFGLGYDSPLWSNLTNNNTFFVENNNEYVKLNDSIDKDKIIIFDYKGITVESSFGMTDEEIENFQIPQKIIDSGPYDVIFIDGPPGYRNDLPGRLLPIYWSKKLLSKNGTIYIDDSKRKLEAYCIDRFFENNNITYLNERDGCVKITF